MGVEQSLLPDSSQEGVNSHLSFESSESLVRGNYLKYQRFPEAKELALRQIGENQELQRNLERQVSMETRENLDKEAMVQQAKKMLYEKLGINENISQNNGILNFAKGVIDTLLFDNIELALQIWETGGKILVDALKQLISWEGIKKIAQSLGENIWNLFTGNAYEKGKSAAELGLISTGLTAGIALGKKGIKLGMKELSRLGLNKERIVQSAEVKGVIHQTKSRIDSIIPKKQVDFEKVLLEDVAKLGNAERKEAAKFYLKRELSPQQQEAIIKAHEVGSTRAGAGIHNYTQKELLEKVRILEQAGFSKEERRVLLEKGVCGKIPISEEELKKIVADIERQVKGLEKLGIPENLSKDLLESGLLNTQFFGGDLLRRFENLYKKGVDYNTMVDEAIKKIPHLTREEALLIFSYTDKSMYERLNAFMRGDKKVLDSLTPHNIEVTRKIIQQMEQAFEKMPDLQPGKKGFILRGDKEVYWLGNIGDKIELKAFTSVANDVEDIFGAAFGNDTKVGILGKTGRIKDITPLAIATNFGGRQLKQLRKTTNEGIILPNSVVEIMKREPGEVGSGFLHVVEVKQIK